MLLLGTVQAVQWRIRLPAGGTRKTRPLQAFLQGLLHQAIHSAIFAAFWKMPPAWVLAALAVMIGVVVYFGLY